MLVPAVVDFKGDTVDAIRIRHATEQTPPTAPDQSLAFMAWAIALGTPSANGLDGITGSLEPKTIDKKFMTDAIRLWRVF